MEKIKRSLSDNVKPVRLYYEDLVVLIGILKEACSEIEIEADDYRLTSVEEFLQFERERIHELRIQGKNPYVVIECLPIRARIYVGQDDLVARGLFEKIKAFFVEKKQPFSFLYHNGLLAGLVFGFAMLFAALALETKSRTFSLAAVVVFLIGVVYSFVHWNAAIKGHSLVYSRKRGELRSFWFRRRDDIGLAVVSALVGALLTLLFSKL